MAQPGGMSGVPTSLGFVGGPEGVANTPGLDFDPSMQDPMADPSSVYDVPPLAFDRNQIPKWVQSAKDQLAKSFNTNSLLDNIFSGPNAGLTLDEIEQQMQQQALMGAVDQDLAMGLMGSEDRFAESMMKLQTLMGNTPQLPEQAPLGSPDPASSIVAGIAAALTPEHAFEIGAVPYQIQQRKQAEENERLMLEYKNQMLQQQAQIEAQKIGVQLDQYRLEWAQQKVDAAQKASDALKVAAENELKRNEGHYYKLATDMANGKGRISDVQISNYVNLAKKIGLDPEAARKEAERWREQKDLELAADDATTAVQQIRLAYSDAYLATPEGARLVADAVTAAVQRIAKQYEYADPVGLEMVLQQAQRTGAGLAYPSKQMMMAQLREENTNMRFKAEQAMALKQFEAGRSDEMFDRGMREKMHALAEREFGLQSQKAIKDWQENDRKWAAERSGAGSDSGKMVQALVKEFRDLETKHNTGMGEIAQLIAERDLITRKAQRSEAEEARLIGIAAELARYDVDGQSRFNRRDALYEQIRALVHSATSGLTPAERAKWCQMNGVTPQMLGIGTPPNPGKVR